MCTSRCLPQHHMAPSLAPGWAFRPLRHRSRSQLGAVNPEEPAAPSGVRDPVSRGPQLNPCHSARASRRGGGGLAGALAPGLTSGPASHTRIRPRSRCGPHTAATPARQLPPRPALTTGSRSGSAQVEGEAAAKAGATRGWDYRGRGSPESWSPGVGVVFRGRRCSKNPRAEWTRPCG